MDPISPILPSILRLARINRIFVDRAAARKYMARRALRPASYAPPRTLRRDVTVSVSRSHGWPVYTVAPAAQTEATTGSVIYLHGGGWVNEIMAMHWSFIAQVAVEARTSVIVPIYPLVPFGAAAEVCETVADLASDAAQRGPIVLAGDSAGGQIALSAALTLKDRGGNAAIPPTPPPTLLISPALDLTWSNPRIPEVQPSDPILGVAGCRVFTEAWKGDLKANDPAVSPLFGDFAGLGEMQLYTGGRDVLNPDAQLLAERATLAGVSVRLHELPDQLHVYPLLPTAQGEAARSEITAWLRGVLRRGVTQGYKSPPQ